MQYLTVLLFAVGLGLLWRVQQLLKQISWQLDWIVVPIREKGVEDVMAFADEHKAWLDFQRTVKAKPENAPNQPPPSAP